MTPLLHLSLPSSLLAPPPTACPRTRLRTTTVGAAVAVLVLAPTAAASAHVRVHPDSTAAGGYAQLTFRVPTESATASTTAVDVQLPTATPFTSVSVKPVPGWTAQVTDAALPDAVDVGGATITRAPAKVVWTAAPDAAIRPGEYQEFSLSVGPLPVAGTEVSLPATQAYSDGTVVRWDEPTPAGGQEPEHPAPVLTTTAGAGEGAAATAGPSARVAAAGTSGQAGGASPGTGSGAARAQWLGAGGLVLGAAALVVALVRGRRPALPRA